MEPMMQKNKDVIGLVGVFLTIFLVVSTIKVIREIRFVGSGVSATNTISVTGKGEVEKSPDTAKISFSVVQESKLVADAQKIVSTKIDAITKSLKDAGIAEKNIVTDSYTSYPQYDYPSVPPCFNGTCPRSVSTPTLRGYQVTHSITVSVKNLDTVPAVLKILGDNQVTDLNGPNFGFEDDKEVAREARDKAIADAKDEAQKLASALGVHLVRIVSFSENGGGGYPMPMYAKDTALAGSTAESTPPSLPVGSQKINANVTVVYEVR